eukprot:g11604.t1
MTPADHPYYALLIPPSPGSTDAGRAQSDSLVFAFFPKSAWFSAYAKAHSNDASLAEDFFTKLPTVHPALYSEFAWRSLSALPAVRPGLDFAVLPDWPAVREYVAAFHSVPDPGCTKANVCYHLFPMFCEEALGGLWDPRATTFRCAGTSSNRIGGVIGDRENLDGKGRVRPVSCAEAKSWLQPPLELTNCSATGAARKMLPAVGATISTATTTAGCLSVADSGGGANKEDGSSTETESAGENHSPGGRNAQGAVTLSPRSPAVLRAHTETVPAPEQALTEHALRSHDEDLVPALSEKQQLSPATLLATSPSSCYPTAVASGTCLGTANPPRGFRCKGYAAVREAVRILTEVEKRDAILKLAKGRGGVGILPHITLEKLEENKLKFGFHDLEEETNGGGKPAEVQLEPALYIVEEMLAGVFSSPTLYMLADKAMLPVAEQVFAPNNKTVNIGNYFPARTRSILEAEQASCVAQAQDLQRYWHFQNVWNLDYVTTAAGADTGTATSASSFVVDVNCGRVPGNLAARLFLARMYEAGGGEKVGGRDGEGAYADDAYNKYPICTLSMGVKTRADNMGSQQLAEALKKANFTILNNETERKVDGAEEKEKEGLLLLYYVPGDWLNVTLVVGKSGGAGGWDAMDNMEKNFVSVLSSLGFDVDADVEIVTEM